MTAVPFVDIAAFDLATGEFLGVFDDVAQGVTVVRVARQRLGVQHELAARGTVSLRRVPSSGIASL
jgi:hypothetical protein